MSDPNEPREIDPDGLISQATNNSLRHIAKTALGGKARFAVSAALDELDRLRRKAFALESDLTTAKCEKRNATDAAALVRRNLNKRIAALEAERDEALGKIEVLQRRPLTITLQESQAEVDRLLGFIDEWACCNEGCNSGPDCECGFTKEHAALDTKGGG